MLTISHYNICGNCFHRVDALRVSNIFLAFCKVINLKRFSKHFGNIVIAFAQCPYDIILTFSTK